LICRFKWTQKEDKKPKDGFQTTHSFFILIPLTLTTFHRMVISVLTVKPIIIVHQFFSLCFDDDRKKDEGVKVGCEIGVCDTV
jgi:hypothetical protein